MSNRPILTLSSTRSNPHTSATNFFTARPFAVLIAAALLGGCSKPATPPSADATPAPAAPAQLAELTVTNPSAFARADAAVTVALTDLGLSTPPTALSVWAGQTEIASQLIDSDGNGSTDSLLAMADFAAGEQQQWQVKASAATAVNKRSAAEISQKTGGQWEGKKYIGGTFENVQSLTPPPQYTDHSEFIRYEGPGIESDRVAYRIYLDWRNGFDIFGNVTGAPVLHQIGQDGYSSYHQMQPWGVDLLKVGKSLGAGGFGYWDGSAAQGVAVLQGHSATIHQSGPLFSSLSIDYRQWQIANRTLDVRAHLSMQAGSRLLRNQLELKAPAANAAPLDNLAIGLVKHPDTELLQGTLEVSGHQYTYLATYGKQSLNNDLLGMAVLFKRGKLQQVTADATSHVAVMELTGLAPATVGEMNPARKLDYYLLAAWQGEKNGITNQADFVTYLQQQLEILDRPIRVKISNPATQAAVSKPLTAAQALYWSQQLADAGLKLQAPHYVWGGWDFERERPTTFEYTTGLLLQAFDDVHQLAPNPAYNQAMLQMADSFVAEDGTIHSYQRDKFNIDSINSGNVLLRAYQQTGAKKYQLAAARLHEQLKLHPKTSNGAFWHKQIYPHQVWLDGVYMGMPFLAHYNQLFNNGQGLEEVVHEFVAVRDKLRDPVTGLYFHGWDEQKQQIWADKTTGLSPEFWSRGIGWLAMAVVDTLDYIPRERKDLRQPLEQMAVELAVALKAHADPESHVWYQIPNKPGTAGNYRESSASSMFVYFYAKALNQGLIDNSYRDFTLQAYQGLLNQFVLIDANGTAHLTQMVQVAGLGFGRDGSYDYYQNEPVIRNDAKGVGPFIMAGVQVARLLQ